MKEGIKTGSVAWGLPGGGYFAPMIASMAGLDGIQLELGSYKDGYPLTQDEVIKGYKDAREIYNIEYPAIVLNDVMEHEFIHGNTTKNGEIAFDQIALGIEAADKLGINRIMIPSFLNNLITEPVHITNTIEALKFACELAESKDIVVLTENALSWEQQKKMLSAIDKKNILVHFDTQNFKYNFNMDQLEQLEHLYNLMDNQLHVKDGIKCPGGKLLGDGNTDFYKQIEFLDKKGFTGWIIIENYYNLQPLRDEAFNNKQIDLLFKDIKTIKNCFGS